MFLLPSSLSSLNKHYYSLPGILSGLVFVARLLSDFAISLNELGFGQHKVLQTTGYDLCTCRRTQEEPYNPLLITLSKVICFICLPFGSCKV
jgi:hypothetical protein